jgi:uridine kinase
MLPSTARGDLSTLTTADPAADRDERATTMIPVRARVVLLAGASGSGKSSLCARLHLPVLRLDDFYREGDDLDLPRRFGIVDWDDPASWDVDAACLTVERLCHDGGAAEVPVYDITTSRRTGSTTVDLRGSCLFVAEGIFAAHLVARCAASDVLAEAICLRMHPAVTFVRRLVRDLAEARKPPLTLVRRGVRLARAEPTLVRRWTAMGCRPMSVSDAEGRISELALAR